MLYVLTIVCLFVVEFVLDEDVVSGNVLELARRTRRRDQLTLFEDGEDQIVDGRLFRDSGHPLFFVGNPDGYFGVGDARVSGDRVRMVLDRSRRRANAGFGHDDFGREKVT